VGRSSECLLYIPEPDPPCTGTEDPPPNSSQRCKADNRWLDLLNPYGLHASLDLWL